MRDGVPERRALRRADRGHTRADRAQLRAPAERATPQAGDLRDVSPSPAAAADGAAAGGGEGARDRWGGSPPSRGASVSDPGIARAAPACTGAGSGGGGRAASAADRSPRPAAGHGGVPPG